MVAGIWCSGEPLHRKRHWFVDGERRLHVADAGGWPLTGEERQALKLLRVPGTAPVLAFGTGSRVVLLDDGAAFRLDYSRGVPPKWRPASTEANVGTKDKGKAAEPVVVSAGTDCQHLWWADRERRVWVWKGDKAPFGGAPVPGTGRVVGVDLSDRLVVLDDGSRYGWAQVGWVRLANISGGPMVKVRCRVLRGVCLSIGGDVAPGDIVELAEAEALPYFARGVLEPAPAA